MDEGFLEGISLRCRALELAVSMLETGTDPEYVLHMADLFDRYIRRGERPSAEVKTLRKVKP